MKRSSSGDRGIAPAIGVVLFLGIVIVFATVTGAVLLSATEEQPVAPEVRLVVDGDTGNELTYDLVHRSGDTLDGDRIEIRGINDPDVTAGQQLSATDSVEVLPTEETITVVWFSEDRDESDVLQRFEVDGPTVVADENCPWVEKKKAAGGDVTVDGIVVNCDIVTEENVVVKNDGKVVGRVESTDGRVTIKTGSTVYERVRAADKVDIDNGTVKGSVTSEDDAVDVDDGTVEGDISAAADVSLPENATIKGSITSEDGDVYVKDGSMVDGSVTAKSGNVDIDGGSVVRGHVYVSGSFSCSGGSTVAGQSCGDYTPRSP